MTTSKKKKLARLLKRSEILYILETGFITKEIRFVRRLSSDWLDEYPGDLGVKLLLSRGQIEDKLYEDAVLNLESLVDLDAEFKEAQTTLSGVSYHSKNISSKSIHGSIKALGGIISKGKKSPPWGEALFRARQALEDGNQMQAESNVQASLLENPKSSLPAIIHLKIAKAFYGWLAVRNLAEMYQKSWPKSIAINLIWADILMESGEHNEAVKILHKNATLDVMGQVAQRLWGETHNYKSLWPENLEMAMSLPIPGAVSKALGWNRISFGSSINKSTSPQTKAQGRKNGKRKISLRSKSRKSKRKNTFRSIREELERVAIRIKQPLLGRADGRFPVFVILTTRHGLVRIYGAEQISAIDIAMQEIAELTRIQTVWNSIVIYADDAELASSLGLTPAKPNDAWSIKNYLKDLDEALRSRGEMIGALMIVGGPKIVPFHHLPNPVDDNDVEVVSDNPYATVDENYFIPSWPIGRVPGDSSTNPETLLHNLNNIIEARQNFNKNKSNRWWWRIFSWLPFRRRLRASFGYTAEVWQRASHSVYRIIGENRALAISPPTWSDELPKRAKQPLDLGYFNLHGLEDAPEWYGQRDPRETTEGPDYPIALRPKDIVNSGRAPQIVYTEACYGGNIFDKKVEDALVLKFLSAGTQAVIGSSCTSYGSISMPLIAADLLGKAFWKLLKEGHTAGEALMRAKIYLAREMHKRQGYLDGEDQKTLIQFILFGDPLAQPHMKTAKSKAFPIQRFPNKNVKTVCDRVNTPKDELQAIPEEIMNQAKRIVKTYLPGMAKSKILFSQEHTECSGHSCPHIHSGTKNLPVNSPSRKVITLSKQVLDASVTHPHFARITLNKEGKVVKLAVSR